MIVRTISTHAALTIFHALWVFSHRIYATAVFDVPATTHARCWFARAAQQAASTNIVARALASQNTLMNNRFRPGSDTLVGEAYLW